MEYFKWGGVVYEGCRHSCGGGFVCVDSRVHSVAHVGVDAAVLGGGVVWGGSFVGGRAVVLGGKLAGLGSASGHAVVEGRVYGVCVSGWSRVLRGGVVRGSGIVRGGEFGGRVRIGGSLRESFASSGEVRHIGLGSEMERFRLLVERELSVMPSRLALLLVDWRVERGVWDAGSVRSNLRRKSRLKGDLLRDRPALSVGEACYLLRRASGVGRGGLGMRGSLVLAMERGERSPERLVRAILTVYGV